MVAPGGAAWACPSGVLWHPAPCNCGNIHVWVCFSVYKRLHYLAAAPWTTLLEVKFGLTLGDECDRWGDSVCFADARYSSDFLDVLNQYSRAT
jgi:hypothetical protein